MANANACHSNIVEIETKIKKRLHAGTDFEVLTRTAWANYQKEKHPNLLLLFQEIQNMCIVGANDYYVGDA
jgi:hypothetical protein